MSKLLCNVLKIAGGANAPNTPTLVARMLQPILHGVSWRTPPVSTRTTLATPGEFTGGVASLYLTPLGMLNVRRFWPGTFLENGTGGDNKNVKARPSHSPTKAVSWVRPLPDAALVAVTASQLLSSGGGICRGRHNNANVRQPPLRAGRRGRTTNSSSTVPIRERSRKGHMRKPSMSPRPTV